MKNHVKVTKYISMGLSKTAFIQELEEVSKGLKQVKIEGYGWGGTISVSGYRPMTEQEIVAREKIERQAAAARKRQATMAAKRKEREAAKKREKELILLAKLKEKYEGPSY